MVEIPICECGHTWTEHDIDDIEEVCLVEDCWCSGFEYSRTFYPNKYPDESIKQSDIDLAKQKWAERTGIPIEEVPWEVIFLSDRLLTEKEKQRGKELEDEANMVLSSRQD